MSRQTYSYGFKLSPAEFEQEKLWLETLAAELWLKIEISPTEEGLQVKFNAGDWVGSCKFRERMLGGEPEPSITEAMPELGYIS